MKSCLVFESYPVFSGSQRISKNVCSVLRKNGYKVTFLASDDQFGNLRNNFGPHVDEFIVLQAGARLTQYGNADGWFNKSTFIKTFLFGLLPYYIKLFLFLRKRRFDYIYFCDPRGASLILPPSVFVKGKKILHFHSKNRLPSWLAGLFIKYVNLVICVSKDIAASLPESDKKVVVYNCLDFTRYTNSSTDVFQKGTEEIVNLLFVGTLKPHKGVHHVLSAVNRLKNKYSIKLSIIGDAQNEHEKSYKQALIEYCQTNELTTNVAWVGWSNDVLGWMQRSDYFIFPSIDREVNNYQGFGSVIESTEGLPTVLIESSLCNTFSIASDVTGVREIISPFENGMIYDPNDETALTSIISETLKHKLQFKSFPLKDNFSELTFEHNVLSCFN